MLGTLEMRGIDISSARFGPTYQIDNKGTPPLVSKRWPLAVKNAGKHCKRKAGLQSGVQTTPTHDEDCFRKEDRDELLKHGWQLQQITEALREIKLTAKGVSDDAKLAALGLEARVRSLENFKWIAWGMGTVVAIMAGYVIQLVAARK